MRYIRQRRAQPPERGRAERSLLGNRFGFRPVFRRILRRRYWETNTSLSTELPSFQCRRRPTGRRWHAGRLRPFREPLEPQRPQPAALWSNNFNRHFRTGGRARESPNRLRWSVLYGLSELAENRQTLADHHENIHICSARDCDRPARCRIIADCHKFLNRVIQYPHVQPTLRASGESKYELSTASQRSTYRIFSEWLRCP